MTAVVAGHVVHPVDGVNLIDRHTVTRSMHPRPPRVPSDALAAGGWRERDREETTPFDATLVRVDAATVVYEDADLRERIRDATGLDRLWRFFVASRLTLHPETSPSVPLSRLVANRAHAGFADVLAERGFEGVRRTDAADVADSLGSDARLASYGALCRLGDVGVRARGLAAVRPSDGAYLLAGGAYPTAVRDAPDETTRDAVAVVLDPDRFREELLELIRGTE